MDKLSTLVPNIFFDLIARVVPGVALLLGIYVSTGTNVVGALLDILVPKSLQSASAPWLVVVLGSSYVAGHLLSPVVRFLEKQAPKGDTIEPAEQRKNKTWYGLVLPFRAYGHHTIAPDLHASYNKLRFKYPAAAQLAIRIRAEYTMYGGLAVALFISLVFFCMRVLATRGVLTPMGHWLAHPLRAETAYGLITVFVILGLLKRHFETEGHFRWTVDDLLRASEANKAE